jgi:hypothetical protein
MGLAQAVLVAVVGGKARAVEIAAALGCARPNVSGALAKLRRRGLIEMTGHHRYGPTAAGMALVESGQQIKRGGGHGRPRKATRGLRQRAWWVIRARRTVTVAELLGTLADGSEKHAACNLRNYFAPLVAAGFLVKVPGNSGYPRYQLCRDNGRLAPVVRRGEGVVFDPNTGECHPYGGRDEPGA